MTDINNTIPLSQPLYGATFSQAIQRFFKKYVVFTGRASRSELWWAFLCLWLVSTVLSVVFAVGGGYSMSGSGLATLALVLLGLWGLAIVLPNIAVMIRRLHDANYSGWMLLLAFVPLVGALIVVILMAMPSKPEGARFDV